MPDKTEGYYQALALKYLDRKARAEEAARLAYKLVIESGGTKREATKAAHAAAGFSYAEVISEE